MVRKHIYGRIRRETNCNTRETTSRKRTKSILPDGADLVFLCGTVFVFLFLYRMTGGLTADAERLYPGTTETAVAVMSSSVAEEDTEREILQEVTGEPFGYMTGEWNLWEYIGDLMASLLMGG